MYSILLVAVSANAQVTLSAPSTQANNGQVVDIPISVIGFENIFSMQFSINWDITVLEFKEVHSFSEALPQFRADGVGDADAERGKLIVVWFDNSLTGVNVADSTEILVLRFQVIGAEGTKSAITFSDNPALIEVVDATSTILEVDLIHGEIALPGTITATTYLQAINGMRLFQNHPNPFFSNTTIKASFNSSEWVRLTITDTYGRSVYQERFKAVSGVNSILIQKENLPASGVYNYTIESGSHQLSKQMIRQ